MDVAELVAALGEITVDLDGYLERRAAELAQPLIDMAKDEAARRIREAESETTRQTDLVTELRRQLAPADRYRQRVKDAEATAHAAREEMLRLSERLRLRKETAEQRAEQAEAERDRLREAVRDYAERRFVDGYLGGGKTWRDLAAELRALADPHAVLEQPGDHEGTT